MDWSKIRWNIFTILLTLINPVANRSCKSCFRSWFGNPDQLSWSKSDCPEGKTERDKFWENSFCNLGELGSKSLGYYSDEHRGNNFAHEVVSIEVNILPRMCFVDIKSNLALLSIECHKNLIQYWLDPCPAPFSCFVWQKGYFHPFPRS